MSETSLNRSDRRRERTREKLVTAARALIASNGVAGLRIAEITDRADVGRGSFYNHFDSKEALVEAVVADSLRGLAERVLAELPQGDSAVAASAADRQFIRLATDDPDLARLLVHLEHSEGLFAAAVRPYALRALEAGVTDGRFALPDLDVALLALTGSAFAVIRAILAGDAPPDADSVHAEYALRMFGVAPGEAREISRLGLTR